MRIDLFHLEILLDIGIVLEHKKTHVQSEHGFSYLGQSFAIHADLVLNQSNVSVVSER